MIHIETISSLIVCTWLLLCSWQDIRKKRINIALIGIGFLILFVCSIIQGNITLWDRLAGLCLGVILLSLNPITRGQIGIGDGMIVSITGLCLGFSVNAILLIYGLFGSAILAIFLLVVRKVNRKNTLPFIPFLFIGYLGVLFIA